MRKSIFTALAAGAVVLAGCAKIETTEVPEGRVIGFDNFVTNAVKALDTEGDGGLTTFYVYGGHTDNTTLFAGTTVSYADGAWSYSPLKYWEATKTYNFAAYSNENGTAENVSLVTDEGDNQYHLKIENYKSDGTKDLIYAYSHGIVCNDAEAALNMPSVELTFYHILSRVAFKFTKDAVSLTGTDIAVSNIQIESLSDQGTFTGENITDAQCPYGAWNGQTGTATKAFDQAGTNISLTDGQADGQTDYEYLIPQAAGGTMTVTFTLTPTGTIVNDNGVSGDHQFSVTLPATSDNQWNPGYTYVYTAEINASNFGLAPIIFDVEEIKGWTGGTINEDDILDDDITGTN